MSNFAGLVVIAIGVVIAVIGIRGTQKVTFAGLFSGMSTNTGLNTTPNCPAGTTEVTSGAFKGLCQDKNGVIQ